MIFLFLFIICAHLTSFTVLLSDPYDFEIGIRTDKISSQTAELFYSGVPEPEVKYVNVYRVVYINDNERTDSQSFKIPKNGEEKKIFISQLKPDVKYVVWLEAFLSNGRKKKSNVVEFSTKAGQLPKPEKSEIGKLDLKFLHLVPYSFKEYRSVKENGPT